MAVQSKPKPRQAAAPGMCAEVFTGPFGPVGVRTQIQGLKRRMSLKRQGIGMLCSWSLAATCLLFLPLHSSGVVRSVLGIQKESRRVVPEQVGAQNRCLLEQSPLPSDVLESQLSEQP